MFSSHLPQDVVAEIRRCPLESAVLRTKMLDMGPPKALLGLVMDPPELSSIIRTVHTLKEVGALFQTVKGVPSAQDGDLSYLGRVIARLPVDVHLGKLIMLGNNLFVLPPYGCFLHLNCRRLFALGYVFNVLEECIIMAAGMGSKNIFTSSFKERLLAYQVKMKWAAGSFSDPITILNAYQLWKNQERIEYFKRSGQSEAMREKKWAEDNYIQLKALKVGSDSLADGEWCTRQHCRSLFCSRICTTWSSSSLSACRHWESSHPRVRMSVV